MPQNLQSNIWKYTLILITNKRVFLAILGAYYLTIPTVTPQWIGTILLVSSITGFLFEIPSGYFADKFGHKETLVIARFLMILSSFFLLIANNVYVLMLGGIFMSLSMAFHSGTGSAFMHETLRALGREKDYSKVMGKASSIGFAVPVVLMVLVPLLVGISYKLPFLIGLILDTVGLITALLLVKPPVTPGHVEEVGVTNFREVVREGYRLHYFRYAIFMGIITGALVAVGVFRAPYQVLLDIPVIWFGVFLGLGRAIAALMLAYSGKLHVYFKDIHAFQSFMLVIFAVQIFLLGILTSPWIVVTLFITINAFQWGLSQVGSSFLLEIIKDSKFKATLLSVPAQVDMAASAVLSFILGVAIEHFSYQSGFLTIAIFFVAILIPLYLYIQRNKSGLAQN